MSVINNRVTSPTRMPVAYAVSNNARSRSDCAASRRRRTSSSLITTGSRRGWPLVAEPFQHERLLQHLA